MRANFDLGVCGLRLKKLDILPHEFAEIALLGIDVPGFGKLEERTDDCIEPFALRLNSIDFFQQTSRFPVVLLGQFFAQELDIQSNCRKRIANFVGQSAGKLSDFGILPPPTLRVALTHGCPSSTSETWLQSREFIESEVEITCIVGDDPFGFRSHDADSGVVVGGVAIATHAETSISFILLGMSSTPLRILVIARDQSRWVQDAWHRLQRFLDQHSEIHVVAAATTKDPRPDDLDVDLAVVLGGDGAILRACRLFGGRQVPILGINMGRLGFLADLSLEAFEQRISCLTTRSFHVVDHLMLECLLSRANGSSERHLVLNELVASSGGSLSMVDVELGIDGEQATTYSGDGLIIATPVGSTAHSLSAGGPILRQDLDAVVITPICPHTLTIRPVVDSADRVYTLRVPDAREGTTLVIDGQVRLPIGRNDSIEVKRAAVTFRLAKLPGHSYYGTLHRKLGWAGQPRYRRLRRDAIDGSD